jgi:hypothetical protein
MKLNYMTKYSWYLDIIPNKMFSLYEYPIEEKEGLPLYEEYGHRGARWSALVVALQ